jgi:hypothetical protein
MQLLSRADGLLIEIMFDLHILFSLFDCPDFFSRESRYAHRCQMRQSIIVFACP